MREVTVQQVPNKPYYGLTDGSKWFFYCYRTRFAANAALQTADNFKEPQSYVTNISYDQPYAVSEFEG